MKEVLVKIQELYDALQSAVKNVNERGEVLAKKATKLAEDVTWLEERKKEMVEREKAVSHIENVAAAQKKNEDLKQEILTEREQLNVEKKAFLDHSTSENQKIEETKEKQKAAWEDIKKKEEALAKEKAEYKTKILGEIAKQMETK